MGERERVQCRSGHRAGKIAGWLPFALAVFGVLIWVRTLPAISSANSPDETLALDWELIQIDPAVPETLLEKADRAAKLNLFSEADRLYRQILLDDPDHQTAYRQLTKLWNGRNLPIDSKSLDAVRDLLPDLTELKTKHFVIRSDAPGHIMQEHATRLERARQEFNRFAKRLKLHPLPLRHRLVCVLFNDRSDYAAFARTHDNVQADWIAGYYTPKHDRIVFYNAQSNPGVLNAHSDLERFESNVEQARAEARRISRNGEARQARQMHQQIEQSRKSLNQQRREVEAFTEHFSTATTVHETVHQLLFHTHVQSPYIEYPFWISEGLATAFEAESVNTSFGPDFEFDLRREAVDELLRDDQFIPLASFVTIIRPPDDDASIVRVLYHQSYALVTWLHRYRRSAFVEYMQMMRRHKPGRLTGPQHRELFQRAFGNIDKLERAWLKDERSQLR